MQISPYLYFNGRCEEALDHYQRTIGAEVTAKMRFSESPEPCAEGPTPPGDKIMHSEFNVGGTKIMASDGMCTGGAAFQGISLAIAVDNVNKAEKLFTALAEGGHVQMPMTKTFFSPGFGMVADKFGVSWMVLAYDPNEKQK